MLNYNKLLKYGWNNHFQSAYQIYQDQNLIPFRVTQAHGDIFTIANAEKEFNAKISGKLRYLIDLNTQNYPVPGDWVLVDKLENSGEVLIHFVLPRFSYFSRQKSGKTSDEQILAANIDYVFIVTGLDRDYNIRRLERYVSLALNCNVIPVIVLNKSDLCEDVKLKTEHTKAYFKDTEIIHTNALSGDGVKAISEYIKDNKSAMLIGSSGCGKSTLLNNLIGKEVQKTGGLRLSDNRGRHTTTSRSLHILPEGGIIIDNPGIREVHLTGDDSGLNSAFKEIEDFALDCKYSDCTHQSEPGCAVQKALADGLIPADSFSSYLKLKNEVEESKEQLIERKKKWEKDIAIFSKELRNDKYGKRKK